MDCCKKITACTACRAR